MLQLIPGSDVASSTEAFNLDQKKGAWTPAASHLRTKSFPTPFAQAEMMSHVLGQLSLDPGAAQAQPETVNDKLQQTFERWRLLALGLVLGEVTLEVVDLRRPEVDNFGAMLADLRPECRFQGLLRDPQRQGAEGKRLLVGATDPLCLFWCSPRVARVNYWSDIKTRIDAHPQRGEALSLLADWKQCFERAGIWTPGHEKAPPWMKGLHVLLGENTRATGALATDAKLAGPVRVTVVPRAGGDAEDLVVYLPVREVGWAARFAELLFFQPKRRDAGTVDLVDPNGNTVVSVRMAPRSPVRDGAQSAGAQPGVAVDIAPVSGFELLAGVGRLEQLGNVGRSHGQAHWLEDHAKDQGIRSLVLNPLLAAAARAHKRAEVSEDDVAGFPIGYPDTLRLVLSGGAAGADGPRILLSREVTNRLTGAVPAPSTGTSMAKWKPGAELPYIVAVPGAAGSLAVGLVEHFGQGDRRVDVGELRGLGFGLWLYFAGEAALRHDGMRMLWETDESKELFGRVLVLQSERALEVLRDGIAAVHNDHERARARDRLATLQRFAATWRGVGEGEGESLDVQAARLGRVAAEHFVAWAMGAPGGVLLGGFGPRATSAKEHYALAPGCRLPLYADPYGE